MKSNGLRGFLKDVIFGKRDESDINSQVTHSPTMALIILKLSRGDWIHRNHVTPYSFSPVFLDFLAGRGREAGKGLGRS